MLIGRPSSQDVIIGKCRLSQNKCEIEFYHFVVFSTNGNCNLFLVGPDLHIMM